ncbi:MAG: AraC family transcriptional regulator [Eubacteriales bacterium]|nr:AraC family transcriptional regulator [Eubacteriales bacterium]
MSFEFVKVVTEDTVEIVTDDTLREMKEHGTMGFPFQYYSEHFDWSRLESVEWHWHKELELIDEVSGDMECQIGDRHLHLGENTGILINSGVIHRFQAPAGKEGSKCDFTDFLFSPEMIAPAHSVVYHKYIQPFLVSGIDYLILKKDIPWQGRMIEQMKETGRECRARRKAAELRIQINLGTMWLEIAEHMEEYLGESAIIPSKNNKNILNQARLRKMMQYIWDNYTERISLDDIAQAANISKSAALRCFRSGLQTSPVGYLNDYRLSRAKEHLLNDKGSISDVAMSVGFDNVGYFDRVFKRAFGVTPKQFIKQAST